MARKKSLRDLRLQMIRLIDADISNSRKNKVMAAYNRYKQNIADTKSYQNARNAQRDARRKEGLGPFDVSPEGSTSRKISEKINTRKYSQRTYMGANAG